MPLYAYFCDRCDTKFEFWRGFDDPPVTVCPDCQTVTLRKTYSPTPVHYKGEGFYVTDKDKPEKLVCNTGKAGVQRLNSIKSFELMQLSDKTHMKKCYCQ